MTAKSTESGEEIAELRQAVRVSETRYSALLGALSEIVLVADARGLVVLPQPSWSRYTGQDEPDCRGRGWLEAVHPEDREELGACLSQGVATEQPFAVSCRIRRAPAGEHRHCEGRAVPLRDERGEVEEWVIAFADVEERFASEERRRAGAERLQRLIDSNVVAICYGIEDRILDGNRAFLDLLRARRSDLLGGLALSQLLVEPGSANPLVFAAGDAHEHAVRRFDDSTGYLLTAGATLSPDPGWLAVVVDVTDRKRAEQTARNLALHDPLTGLPNRRLLVDRLDHALSGAARDGSLVGVAFCDLDRFKEVNDHFGHLAGDRVLSEISRRLKALSREADTVARVGGDEFVVVLEHLDRADDAIQIAERIRSAVAEPIIDGESELVVTASIGLAFSDAGRHDREALLSQADDAMYKAKQDGRNRVTMITSTDLSSHAERRWIERELTRALNDDTLDVAFQPLIDLHTRRPVAAEALLRWTVEGRSISPASAIGVAERTGIITRVSDWVVKRACQEFVRWRLEVSAPEDWTVHINISARDLADRRCVPRLLRAIDEGGCAPEDVCLEVTETAVWHDLKPAYARLAQLRASGIGVAIDDFGTGYASLDNLREVPADVVKIDRCFVAELSRSTRDQAIVKYAIGLAHELGLRVVAEGIETRAQLAILSELGCDQGQGYLFGHPQSIDLLEVDLAGAGAAAFET